MNAAIGGGIIAINSALNYRAISPFEDLKITIRSADDYKQVVAWLFALGYAWSDDSKTQCELFYGVLPEFLYVSYNANIYFDLPNGETYKCVGGLYVHGLLQTKFSKGGC